MKLALTNETGLTQVFKVQLSLTPKGSVLVYDESRQFVCLSHTYMVGNITKTIKKLEDSFPEAASGKAFFAGKVVGDTIFINLDMPMDEDW